MDIAQKRRQIVSWLQDQVRQANASGLVFGLSGGIDSAVVAGLAKEAFPDDALGVILPCHSDPQDVEDALAVAKALDLQTVTIDLSDAWSDLVAMFKEGAQSLGGAADTSDPAKVNLVEANVKPRLRMTSLYYLAGLRNYLVAGTENRVELTIGYFTKYGDGGVDLLPLGNLVKGEVKELAKDFGIPSQVIDKVPTAGLWEGQTDEEEIGLSYDVIDAYLTTGEGPPHVKEKITQLERASAHKRNFPPIPPV